MLQVQLIDSAHERISSHTMLSYGVNSDRLQILRNVFYQQHILNFSINPMYLQHSISN